MSETLSFPGLGLEFEINRVAFTVGGISVYWYGILIAAAFLAGAVYTLKRVREFGLDGDRFIDVILGGVILGIIGARLYYVAFSWDTYRDNPVSILNIRLGGIAIYGGLIGAAVAVLLVCRFRRVKLLPALDLAAGGIILGQAIGRWGNFVNIEAFGSNTSLPWGMTSPTIEWYLQQHRSSLSAIGVTVDPSMPVHPTFFYESAWCLLGFLFLAWYTGRRRFDGELSLIYLGWYGLGRALIEGLRTDPLLIGSVRVSQLVAVLCVLASMLTLIIVRSRIRREGDPDYLKLYVHTDEGRAVLAGEFYPKKEKASEPSGERTGEKETEAEQTGKESPEGAPDETAETPDGETKEGEPEAEGQAAVDTEKENDNGEAD